MEVHMNAAIIGLGLIGGSFARDLRDTGFASRIIGVENNPAHAELALKLGLVDEIMPLARAARSADLVLVAIPVTATAFVLKDILDAIGSAAVVTDVGSTKHGICLTVAGHPRRGRFVASHPIAGTENSGPAAALPGLFRGKLGILCDIEKSDPDAAQLVRNMYDAVGMRLLTMDSDNHDRHVAYVSHISHITSFVLATTVLEIEKNTTTIFDLAGSGFESTVRLAKSSPDMWTPIFMQNAPFVCEALDAYIRNITRFKEMIERGSGQELHTTMEQANEIRRVLSGMNGNGTTQGSTTVNKERAE
jgi:prephenate dehydrogenase